MANPLLGQILASVIGNRLAPDATSSAPSAPADAGLPGGLGGLGGGVLGGLLAGMIGRAGGNRPSNNRGLLLAMLLPLAMRWVQQNGGLSAVLDRFRGSGLGKQADSWVSGNENHEISAQDVQRVIGQDDIARFAQQLGVPQQDVSQAFAEILPELTDKLTPQGSIPPQASDALHAGSNVLERALQELHSSTPT
jgi:uncharacterized protein YidB (DUF937 family)